MSRLVPCIALAAALSAAACGSSRQSAATQATPVAFDASKSDPKAVAVADQVLAALGGEANWQKAHEVQWFQAIVHDGKMVDAVLHSWDRWNGRHAFKRVDPAGKLGVSMHDLFSQSGGYGFVEDASGGHKSVAADKITMIAEARKRFDTDTYPIFLPYKLKDPGVHLKLAEERPAEGSMQGSPMKYDVIQITFDDGVGPAAKDTWYLVVDKATHMPDSVEHVPAGKSDNERSGFTLENWVDAGGLKFATVRKTLGYTKADAPQVQVQFPKEWMDAIPKEFASLKVPSPGEVVYVADVKVNAEPTEDEYVPTVE